MVQAPDPLGPLAIIAGQGDLPVLLAEAAGRPVLLAEMEGHPTDNPGGHPVVEFRVERLGALFKALRAAGVRELVMAGAMHRPRIDLRKFDLKSLMLAPKIAGALKSGDDAAIRATIGIFEREGFRVRGAHEFLSQLVVRQGPVAGPAPSKQQQADAARARAILTTLGPLDVAQACVVARGQCLGIESVYGTDALLGDVARHRPERQPEEGGVLVKIAKPGQEMRADMPVIGPETIRAAAAAGLGGICLEADRLMLLEPAAVIALAEAKGISLWAM